MTVFWNLSKCLPFLLCEYVSDHIPYQHKIALLAFMEVRLLTRGQLPALTLYSMIHKATRSLQHYSQSKIFRNCTSTPGVYTGCFTKVPFVAGNPPLYLWWIIGIAILNRISQMVTDEFLQTTLLLKPFIVCNYEAVCNCEAVCCDTR